MIDPFNRIPKASVIQLLKESKAREEDLRAKCQELSTKLAKLEEDLCRKTSDLDLAMSRIQGLDMSQGNDFAPPQFVPSGNGSNPTLTAVTISGNTITAKVSGSLLPSTGFGNKLDYTFNLWPRDGAFSGTAAIITAAPSAATPPALAANIGR